MDGIGQNEEWAANQFLDAWEEDRQVRQAAWDEVVAQEERESEEIEAERIREEEEARKAEEKKKVKFPPIAGGMLPPKDSGFRPWEKAATRLKNREFIELRLFTFAGCGITKDADLNDEDGTISFTQEDGNVRLRRSSSVASNKHLIVPDECLPWKDVLRAKNVFLEQIAKHGWPGDYLHMFAEFYYALELHSELCQVRRHGEKILVLYHARARREGSPPPLTPAPSTRSG